MKLDNNSRIFIVAVPLVFIFCFLSFVFYLYISQKYDKQVVFAEKKSDENIAIHREKIEKEKLDILKSHITQRIINTDGSDFVIPTQGKAVFADLTDMKLRLIENGEIKSELDILAKGKEGSRYETPVGVYKILTKEINHRVSVADIYMPYSMQFFGNFFIHGRPYYSNGVNLRDGDSGGCIRLSNTDSKEVFDFVNIGTPVFIAEKNKTEDLESVIEILSERSKTAKKLPNISADSYIVADINTGFVFAEKDATNKLSISNLSNFMTAVVSEEINRDDREVVANSENVEQNLNDDIKHGDVFTVTEILGPLLMGHGHVSADSIASRAGKRTFVGLMNIKASSLGMDNTEFLDYTPSNPMNISTAEDIFRLTSHIYKKHPYIPRIIAKDVFNLEENDYHDAYSWSNKNLIFDKISPVFVKVGKNFDSKEVSTSVFDVKIGENNRKIAVVVLNSESQKMDTENLFDWVKNTFEDKSLSFDNN